MTSPWLIPDWPAPANVRACVSTRAGGVSQAPFDSFNLGDHVGDERGVHVAQFSRGDPVADERADPPGGEAGVAFVHLPGRRGRGHVLHEAGRRRFELPADRFEVGPDPGFGAGAAGEFGLDAFGGAAEEVHGHGVDEAVLVLREGVQGGLRAAETGGDVVEGEVGEPFGQEQRHELVEQLHPSGRGASGSRSCHTQNSTGVSLSVLFPRWRSLPCLSSACCPPPKPGT